MRIVVSRPPNFDEIVAVFPMATRRGVVFTYGGAIYNPSAIEIPRQIIAHEEVHAERQGTDPEEVRAWWSRYLRDADFRADEETRAHRAEYHALRAHTKDRNVVVRGLDSIAGRLSSPLYGGMLSKAHARALLVAEVYPPARAPIRYEAREVAA